MILGALEAGGTKMVCAIGNEQGEISERISIPTVSPEETMPQMIAFFREHHIEALGVGCFGPINPVKGTATYGYITSTPKLAWQEYNIVGAFEEALGCPVGFDTDVNASMLGEATFGIAKGLDSCIYVTIGTGVGVGVYINGGLLHGMMHPEAGHIFMDRRPDDPLEQGVCPYHANCLEGLASGPAIERRWGRKAQELADCDAVWELESYYIAQAVCDYIMVLSPERIILGGGVMHQPQLLPLVRRETARLLGGYLPGRGLADLDTYIVAPGLGDDQGILGCVQLAADAYLASGGAL